MNFNNAGIGPILCIFHTGLWRPTVYFFKHKQSYFPFQKIKRSYFPDNFNYICILQLYFNFSNQHFFWKTEQKYGSQYATLVLPLIRNLHVMQKLFTYQSLHEIQENTAKFF